MHPNGPTLGSHSHLRDLAPLEQEVLGRSVLAGTDYLGCCPGYEGGFPWAEVAFESRALGTLDQDLAAHVEASAEGA